MSLRQVFNKIVKYTVFTKEVKTFRNVYFGVTIRKNNNVYLGVCTRTVKVSSSNRGHLSIFIEPYVHILMSICQTARLVKPDKQNFL